MKKFRLCVLCLLLALSLVACQGNKPTEPTAAPASPSPSAQTDSPDPTGNFQSEDPNTAKPPEVVELDANNNGLTNRQIIEDTLADKAYTKDGRQVHVLDIEDGWIEFYIPGNEFSRVCLNHLYSSSNWTLESIVQSYSDGSAPWLDASSPDYGKGIHTFDFDTVAVLWSADYNYEFTVSYDGWLYVNGRRSLPFACITYDDLDPMLMIERYQSGEWDGTRAWSKDYRTSVALYYLAQGAVVRDWDELHYEYDNTETDLEALSGEFTYVHPQPATGPWWETTTHHYDVDTYNTFAIVKNVYPDLPGGTLEGSVEGELVDKYSAYRRNGSEWIITTTGPYQFSKGELVNHWRLPLTFEGDAVMLGQISYQNEDHMYFFDEHRLLDLRANGKYDVLLPEVSAWGAHECWLYFYYLDGDALKCATTGESEEIYYHTVIDDRAVAAVTGRYEIFVAFKDSDNVYAISNWYSNGSYQLAKLGPGTVDQYDAMWREWYEQDMGTYDEFIIHCQITNGVEPT